MSHVTRREALKAAGTVAGALTLPAMASPRDGAPSAPPPLVFDKPAAEWTEALPIGNGRLGAMVHGGVGEERLQLNEDSLWSGEPYDNVNPQGLTVMPAIRNALLAGDDVTAQRLIEAYVNGRNNQCYEPLADLLIAFDGPQRAQGYRRALDIAQGVAEICYDRPNGDAIERTCFASYADDVIVVRVRSRRPGGVTFSARLSCIHPVATEMLADGLAIDGCAPAHADPHYVRPPHTRYEPQPGGRGMRFRTRIRARARGGRLLCEGGRILAYDCDEVLLLVAAATSYAGPFQSPSRAGRDPVAIVADVLARAGRRSYDDLRQRHVADHRALFDRVALRLGPVSSHSPAARNAADPALDAFYFQYGRYLLIASSRVGTQPANLQGLWNRDPNPDWSANWTLNCNAQINYWGAESANLAACHQPLLALTQQLSRDGAHVARRLYGVDGWVAHHNTDIWRQAAPVGGSAQWTIFQCGGAWLCQHLWEHYAFNRDTTYLRSIWPTLIGAATFYCQSMVVDPKTGHLLTAPDVAFENRYLRADGTSGVVCMGPAGSMQMVRELFHHCLEAACILRRPAGETRAIRRALLRLPPTRVSPRTGEIMEWQADWDRGNECQLLSAWGLICAGQITPRGTPALAQGIRAVLTRERWWARGLVGSWQGAMQAMAFARLHDGDTAHQVLRAHLAMAVNPNFTAAFPGNSAFQIDGNLGFMAAMVEMLLQSHAGEIDLLPALPAAWGEGAVRGLRARGGVEVDIAWRGGVLARAVLKGMPGTRVTVRYGTALRKLVLRGFAATLDARLRDTS